MKVVDAIRGLNSLFLDSAPVIYFVENNPEYIRIVDPIFALLDSGAITAVSSVVTLAECLVSPLRLNLRSQVQLFTKMLAHSSRTRFVQLGQAEAETAADLRARYNLRLPDALQVAAALSAGCDALLTNDGGFRRVTELRVLV